MKEALPYLTLILSAIACLIAAWNVVRTGNWRKTDEAKALFKKVGDHDSRFDLLDARVGALPTRTEHAELAEKVNLHDHRINQLPTKADLAELSGKVTSLQQQTNNIDRGVERIESHLMGQRT